MTRKSIRQKSAGNYLPPPPAMRARRIAISRRQPFWLPAPSYYVLAAAIAITVFFVVWGILHEVDNTPWIPAGVLGGAVLIGAVIVREIVLRKRRRDLLLAQERLDQNLKNVYVQRPQTAGDNKLTLEKNAEILKQIVLKSEAANVFGKFSEAHWEVFELCDEYLNLSNQELQTVSPGSPRRTAINQGREKVKDLHKFHLLAWSSTESRELIQEAKASVTISKRLELAVKAQSVLESAIQFYPAETKLLDSQAAINEFIASMKVSHWIEQAERFVFKGNYKRAISSYRDALFYLERENVQSDERDLTARKINLEIERLKKVSGTEKQEINAINDDGKILGHE